MYFTPVEYTLKEKEIFQINILLDNVESSMIETLLKVYHDSPNQF